MKILKIYPDGGYNPHTKIGAVSFVVVQDRKIIFEFSKAFNKNNDSSLTINKMELLATVKALKWLKSNGFSPKKHMVFINVDSSYVHLGVNLYLDRRKSKGTHMGLWSGLDILLKEALSNYEALFIQWDESHSGNVWNDRAHELCNIAMKNYINSKIKVNV